MKYRPNRKYNPKDPADTAEESDVNGYRVRGLLSALSEVIKSQRELVTTTAEQQGQNWRAAANAISRYDSAVSQGILGDQIKALVDLAKLKLSDAPVDRDQISRLESQVGALMPGQKGGVGGSEDFNRVMWQEYAKDNAAPGGDPRVYGTFHAMLEKYGDPSGYLGSMDANAKANYNAVVKQAELQSEAIDRAR